MTSTTRPLGKTSDAARYAALLASLKQKYHAAFWDAKMNSYGDSQCANALALYLDIPPTAATRAGAQQWLLADLEKRGSVLTTGALGTRYVFAALAAVPSGPLGPEPGADREAEVRALVARYAELLSGHRPLQHTPVVCVYLEQST